MGKGLGRRAWLRSVLAAIICLWLAITPILVSNSLWAAESECCCGAEGACLLGGCDCGRADNAPLGDCGGLRSADGANEDAVVLSSARHLGLVLIDLPVDSLVPMGRAVVGDELQRNLPMPAPDPPPPRPLGAL